jgi:peptidoglycan L-alanyl-D-glutamate endopeptidase CwlK
LQVFKDIKELTAPMQKKCKEFLRIANARLSQYDLKLSISETYRSQARQNALYAQGRTTPGPIITWTKRSPHTQRKAFDVHFEGINGKLTHPYKGHDETWDMLGGLWTYRLKAKWGGGWGDRPHFEMK